VTNDPESTDGRRDGPRTRRGPVQARSGGFRLDHHSNTKTSFGAMRAGANTVGSAVSYGRLSIPRWRDLGGDRFRRRRSRNALPDSLDHGDASITFGSNRFRNPTPPRARPMIGAKEKREREETTSCPQNQMSEAMYLGSGAISRFPPTTNPGVGGRTTKWPPTPFGERLTVEGTVQGVARPVGQSW